MRLPFAQVPSHCNDGSEELRLEKFRRSDFQAVRLSKSPRRVAGTKMADVASNVNDGIFRASVIGWDVRRGLDRPNNSKTHPESLPSPPN